MCLPYVCLATHTVFNIGSRDKTPECWDSIATMPNTLQFSFKFKYSSWISKVAELVEFFQRLQNPALFKPDEAEDL